MAEWLWTADSARSSQRGHGGGEGDGETNAVGRGDGVRPQADGRPARECRHISDSRIGDTPHGRANDRASWFPCSGAAPRAMQVKRAGRAGSSSGDR
jgi:hypothetical protein